MSKDKSTNQIPALSAAAKEALDSHPERIVIEFAGKKRAFLLSGRGAKIARAKGIDPVPSITALIAKVAPAFGEVKQARNSGSIISWIQAFAKHVDSSIFDTICTVLWWGFLTYDPDLEYDVIEAVATPKSVYTVFAEVWEKVQVFADENAIEEAKASTSEKGTEGN